MFQESFGAIRTVRSFAQEVYEISRYSEKVNETLNLGLKQAVSALLSHFRTIFSLSYQLSPSLQHLFLAIFLLQKVVGIFFGSVNAASTLSVIAVVIYGANLTITGSMTPGALTSFILYSLTGYPLLGDM